MGALAFVKRAWVNSRPLEGFTRAEKVLIILSGLTVFAFVIIITTLYLITRKLQEGSISTVGGGSDSSSSDSSWFWGGGEDDEKEIDQEEENDTEEVPEYVVREQASSCQWDSAHNVCDGYSQGLKSYKTRNMEDSEDSITEKYLSMESHGFLGLKFTNFAEGSLRFHGSTAFVISNGKYPCNAALSELHTCRQVYLMSEPLEVGTENVSTGPRKSFFGVPPHNNVLNLFSLVRRDEDPNLVNLRVIPNERCESMECKTIRNEPDAFYLAIASTRTFTKAREDEYHLEESVPASAYAESTSLDEGFVYTMTGGHPFYITRDKDSDDAIWMWDWTVPSQEAVQPTWFENAYKEGPYGL